MDVGSLLIADTKATKLIQPTEGSFYDPAPTSQPTAMFPVSLRDERDDLSKPQAAANRLRIVTSVPLYTVRRASRMTSLLPGNQVLLEALK